MGKTDLQSACEAYAEFAFWAVVASAVGWLAAQRARPRQFILNSVHSCFAAWIVFELKVDESAVLGRRKSGSRSFVEAPEPFSPEGTV